jgi:hypothetical protein
MMPAPVPINRRKASTPQAGQARNGVALIDWNASKRCWQLSQT